MNQPAELPLLLHHDPGGRSLMTCRFRCGDACSRMAPNRSGNEQIDAVIGRLLRRRGLEDRSRSAGTLLLHVTSDTGGGDRG